MKALALLVLAALLAGCSAQGAGTSNFDLKPTKVGWFAGDEARFTLNLTPSLLNGKPSFTLDRRFAIEQIKLAEHGINFGGNYETRDPDAVAIRLERAGTANDTWVLDAEHPGLDIILNLPGTLRDSEYSLELKVFQVGWVKSGTFRVDRR